MNHELMNRRSDRASILVFADYYLPGFKAGGAIRSIANIVEQLGDDFSFRIVTRDRDSGDTKPYAGIRPNAWQPVGKAQVFYLSPIQLRAPALRRLIADGESQVAYLNSFFSPALTIQTLTLRRAGFLPRIPLVVAPRGEFSPNALRLKRMKKLAYLMTAKAVGLYDGVLWQASSALEAEYIHRWFGSDASVLVAPDVSGPTARATHESRARKSVGKIKIVFVSRISRKKNLHAALKLLAGASGVIDFDIYGPIDDEVYWHECQSVTSALPINISVKYHGAIEHDQVTRAFNEGHLFLMPTLGENYGHAIAEALLAGCPVLISDQTPWRDLESKRAGWDIPLDRGDLFQRALQTCIDMDDSTYGQWARCAREYATRVIDRELVVAMSRALFERALVQGVVA